MSKIISPYELSEDERSTIDNALSVAQEKYVECAKIMREPAKPGEPDTSEVHRRMAQQFDRQVDSVAAIRVKLAAADTITTVTSPAEESRDQHRD